MASKKKDPHPKPAGLMGFPNPSSHTLVAQDDGDKGGDSPVRVRIADRSAEVRCEQLAGHDLLGVPRWVDVDETYHAAFPFRATLFDKTPTSSSIASA